jgi:hypothetical protein
MSYTITVEICDEMELIEKNSYFLTIPADKIIGWDLGRSSFIGGSLNQSFKNRLIDYARFALSNTDEPSKYFSKQICNLDDFKDTKELNLVNEPPKIMTFYLQYNEFFDAREDVFPSRKQFVSILPESFSLSELFIPMHGLIDSFSSSISIDNVMQTYYLKSIIGYYGYHYIAFNMCSGGDW